MDNNKMSFEQSMQRLEQIVRLMEQGDAPLDESLKLFQEGTSLAERCAKLLDDAELVIKKVVTEADGTPAEEVFKDEE